MIRVKKRRKSERRHGKQTAFRGSKKRTRGSGNRGGKGMAGTGKRGDQKKTLVINLTGGNNYFGKDKTLRRGFSAKPLLIINVQDIEKNLTALIKQGRAKLDNGRYVIHLLKYKVLGGGEVNHKLHIHAAAASASAIEKVKEKGGEIFIKNSIAKDL